MLHKVSSDDFALVAHQRLDVSSLVSSEIDTDLDGVPDVIDAFALDSTESLDTDGDGTSLGGLTLLLLFAGLLIARRA